METLGKKWITVQEDDRRILPMFETFECIIGVMSPDLAQDYVKPLFDRSLAVLEGVV